MDIRDSQRIKEIRDNTRAMAEAFGRIADTLAEALELYVSTQTETQNSNLTFEKDECAKEYEELGLKELKELIEADRKDEFFREPTAEERKAVADYIDSISVPTGVNVFDFMDEPTSSKMEQVEDETRLTAKCLNCANGGSYKCSKCDGEMYFKDEPQTCEDCRHNGVMHAYDYACDKCTDMDKFQHEDEPQTERSE